MGLIMELIIKVTIMGLMMEIFITPFPFMGFNFPFMLDPLVFVRMYIYMIMASSYVAIPTIQIHNYI